MLIGHSKAREVLTHSLANLSHAYHFSGIEGIGKKLFAVWIAKYLLCEKGSPLFTPCACPSCTQVDNNMHPDLHRFSDNKKKKDSDGSDSKDDALSLRKDEGDKDDYAVESIRRITEIVDSTSYSGKWKVIILDGAHRLSSGGQTAAANSLLKTLEEPGSDTVFFLVTHRSDLMLSTILSRCQTVHFSPLSLSELEQICQKNGFNYNRDLLSAAGGSVSNLLCLTKFDIKGFLTAADTGNYEELAERIFSFSVKDRHALPVVIDNLRIHLIQKHSSFNDKSHIQLIQYLDRFSKDIQYNVNINIMLLDLYANLTRETVL
ncbi:MAG: AAA family ATPase [Deferribacteraceae bacterium]|jgi:DNA polymerase-3 subunit delta'|nr:AAA family ATPase [Deferribacteraceae bacterium]